MSAISGLVRTRDGGDGVRSDLVSRLIRGGLALGAAVAVGLLAAIAPLPTLIVALALVAFVFLLARPQRTVRMFLGALAALLVGYAFFGRGLAHVGAPPLYLGEMVLLLGGVAFLLSLGRLHLSKYQVPLVAFMLWGLIQTVPYLGRDGIDSLRDAVTWGYGFFALAVSGLVGRRRIATVVRGYRRVIPLFLVWVPIFALLGRVVELPAGPGSEVPIVYFKGGDTGVHLAGVAAFVLLGLYGASARRVRLPEPILWAVWLIGAFVVGILNRGGMAAMTTASATILFVRSAGRWFSPAFVTVLLLVLLLLVDPVIDFGGSRKISFGQMLENVTSILGEGSDAGLEGTKEYRLAWWSTVVDYTVAGPFFWTGKGFGVNLADSDGFQVTSDGSLRAPHNGHVEILARMGVPGLILWVVLNAGFALGLLRAAYRARRAGRLVWTQICGWLFVYWAAAMVNASFDPYLQGPQGGIWFWSLMGLGIAAIRESGRDLDLLDDRPQPARPAPAVAAAGLSDTASAIAPAGPR